MTDRFYPVGKHSAEDVWKSSYEVQNEMRSFQRSAYPPGYAGHEPGARERFGYSTPGPFAHRLAKPELALKEEDDNDEDNKDDDDGIDNADDTVEERALQALVAEILVIVVESIVELCYSFEFCYSSQRIHLGFG